MKKRYLLTLSALSVIMLNQQTLQARSETVEEINKGAASGEEAAGPVGAAVGGLFGGAVGLVRDTGDTVTGRTEAEKKARDQKEESDEYVYEENMTDESDMEEPETYERSETSREMEKGAASGEEMAGPVGGVVGGLFGAGVGAVKDTGDFVTGRTAEEREALNQEEEAPMTMHGQMEEDGTLTIDETE